MARRSKSRGIGGVSFPTLFGILLISFCAFFGFRTLFSDLNQNIGVEALAAAFGALFVLLPTKILMDQENENKVEGDKRTTVFGENLDQYRKISVLMFKILMDEKIEEAELKELRAQFYDLMILGSDDSIDSALNFIEICVAKFKQDNNTSRRQPSVDLDPEDYKNLLTHALDFVAKAREGLKLSDDDFVWTEKYAERVIDMATDVAKEKSGARQEITGKLEGWVKLRSYENYKPELSNLIGAIKNKNPEIKEKYTKSAISFADAQVGRNVFYIDYIAKREEKVKCGFPLLTINSQTQMLKTQIEEEFAGSDGITVTTRETGDHQILNLRLEFELKKLSESNLLAIGNVVSLYAKNVRNK